MSQLYAHNKMLENQIASQASSSRQSSMLPSQSEHPREQVKTRILRSGRQLLETETKSQEEGVVQDTREEEQKTEMIEEKKDEKRRHLSRHHHSPFLKDNKNSSCISNLRSS